MADITDNQKPDHDLIIELKTGFDIFLKQYHLDMVELKDGYSSKMADQEFHLRRHDDRLQRLEAIVDAVNPEQTVAEFHVVQQQVRDFVVTANVFRIVAGVIGGLIVFILTQLPAIVKNWGFLR